MRVIALILFFLMAIAAPVGAVWFTVTTWGTPHIVYRYTFHDNGDQYNPRAPRHYLTCTYWGHFGTIRVQAKAGRCPWVQFFTNASADRERR